MAPDLSTRSYQKEMLDAPEIPADLLNRNLEELETINRLLGGHRISIKGLKHFLRDRSREYHIADVGCGGGDTMKVMAEWGRKNGFSFRFTGIDINADAISFAQKSCKDF